MTPEELAEKKSLLQAQMDELQKSLIEIKKQEQELIDKQPITLIARIDPMNGSNRVTLYQNPVKYDKDFVEMLKTIPSRRYHGEGINSLLVEDWSIFIERLNALNSNKTNQGMIVFTLTYEDGTEEYINKLITKPNYIITLNEEKDKLEVEVNPLIKDVNLMYGFEGARVIRGKFNVAISEGYRLWQVSQSWPKVEWALDAKELVLKDLEKRSSLDRLWDTNDSSLSLSFNNYVLRPFQNQSIEFLEAVNGRAIIAHSPGLGKTLCAIAFKEYKNLSSALIVCPASLKLNWAKHIENITGHTPMILSGSLPSEFDIFALLYREKPKYVIVNYDVLGSKKELVEVDETNGLKTTREKFYWLELLNNASFDLIVLDESHRIKNVDSNRSKAAIRLISKHVICLTGTPVMNRPGELWAQLTLVSPEEFPSYENFLQTYTYDGKQAKNVNILRQMLRRLMFRKTTKDVIKDLPAIERVDEFFELNEKYRDLYNKAIQGVYQQLNSIGEVTRQQDITSILAEIMRCKQICSAAKVERVSELAVDLSDNDEGKKVLIFSQFKETVYNIATLLGNEVVTVTGDIDNEEREKRVKEFQTNDTIKFLVGTWQTMGEGLDLTAASYVIFADLFWTPANHQQCEARAYGRLSDLHPVVSYYIRAVKTLEDWIMELLFSKLKIIEEVVEGVSNANESIANDLIKRIRMEMGR